MEEEEEAQHLAFMHFAVCPTNPTMIQNRKERKEATHHRRQQEQEERDKDAKLKKTTFFLLWQPPLGITEGRGTSCNRTLYMSKADTVASTNPIQS